MDTVDREVIESAKEFFAKRGWTLAYGGRGKYRGMWHLSGMAGNGFWVAFKTKDVSEITDRPSEMIKILKNC